MQKLRDRIISILTGNDQSKERTIFADSFYDFVNNVKNRKLEDNVNIFYSASVNKYSNIESYERNENYASEHVSEVKLVAGDENNGIILPLCRYSAYETQSRDHLPFVEKIAFVHSLKLAERLSKLNIKKARINGKSPDQHELEFLAAEGVKKDDSVYRALHDIVEAYGVEEVAARELY